MKLRYEINIGTMLIIGVVFLIWGISLTEEGVVNQKKLNQIYESDTDIMSLKENNYIRADTIRMMTRDGLTDSDGRTVMDDHIR